MESAQDNQGRILLVDDESAILRTFRYCLEDEGYSVATANSAAQAETLLQRQVFDLCFLDLRLTNGDCFLRIDPSGGAFQDRTGAAVRELLPHAGRDETVHRVDRCLDAPEPLAGPRLTGNIPVILAVTRSHFLVIL